MISEISYNTLKWLYNKPDAIIISYHRLYKMYMGFNHYTIDCPIVTKICQIDYQYAKELIEREFIDVAFLFCEDNDNDYSTYRINNTGEQYLGNCGFA